MLPGFNPRFLKNNTAVAVPFFHMLTFSIILPGLFTHSSFHKWHPYYLSLPPFQFPSWPLFLLFLFKAIYLVLWFQPILAAHIPSGHFNSLALHHEQLVSLLWFLIAQSPPLLPQLPNLSYLFFLSRLYRYLLRKHKALKKSLSSRSQQHNCLHSNEKPAPDRNTLASQWW